MIKKALEFINEEIRGCIMNIDFCKHKGYDSPLHDQRLIDLNNLKEAFEKLVDKATPTLEEVKKEWEALGYEWRTPKEYPHMINLVNDDDDLKWILTIKINTQSKKYWKRWGDGCFKAFTFQEHQLLTKTFRALGWEV